MPKPDTTGVRLPPPLIYLGFLAVGLALDYYWPFSFVPQNFRYWIGVPVVSLSFVLFGLVLREFLRSKTSIDHGKPTTQIIVTGPFQYSRNPVYLSGTLFVIGAAIALDSFWVLVMVIPAMWTTYQFVILREEAYLERKFGDEYLNYKKRVRRWI